MATKVDQFVEKFKHIFKKHKAYDDSATKIVVSKNSISQVTEGYNRLRDNILFLNSDGTKKAIQIESSLAHEGKTTVASNLAVSLGFVDKKVCIVDLDFRRPKVHRVFGLSKENGISDYILGKISYEETIKKTQYENVDIVTRGSVVYNSSIILISDKFKAFMKKLRDTYDYVIVDSSPILQVSDYIHVSKVTDGVLFVVAYATTTKAQATEAVEELRKNDVKILGSVFSMYDSKKDNGVVSYNKYYYNAYKKAYGEDEINAEAKKSKSK